MTPEERKQLMLERVRLQEQLIELAQDINAVTMIVDRIKEIDKQLAR
jgi:hypothetical protein